jgi:hypothetical protein
VVEGEGRSGGHVITATAGNGASKQTFNYATERIVGNGSFGVVFQATCLETAETVRNGCLAGLPAGAVSSSETAEAVPAVARLQQSMSALYLVSGSSSSAECSKLFSSRNASCKQLCLLFKALLPQLTCPATFQLLHCCRLSTH